MGINLTKWQACKMHNVQVTLFVTMCVNLKLFKYESLNSWQVNINFFQEEITTSLNLKLYMWEALHSWQWILNCNVK